MNTWKQDEIIIMIRLFSFFLLLTLSSTYEKVIVSKSTFHGQKHKQTELTTAELQSIAKIAGVTSPRSIFVYEESSLVTPLLTSTARFTARRIAFAPSAELLILICKTKKLSFPSHSWGIMYEKLSTSRFKSESFTSKTLLCSIAQTIRGDICLDASKPRDNLLVVEDDEGFHLLLIEIDLSSEFQKAKDCWNSRPFQYSASLSLEVSVAAVNILKSMIPCK
jgi:hypothetical protein